MADIDWLLERVEAAPNGPGVAAFFDFDGTLIDGYSASAFFKHMIRRGHIGARDLLASLNEAVKIERRGKGVEDLMKIGVQAQAGQLASDVDEWARSVFAKRISGMMFPQARMLIEAHQAKGHTIVVASSATPQQIQPAAEELGIPNVICTEVEIDDDGFITGELASPIRWGQGKADAVSEFAEKWDLKMADSFAYGNGGEDVQFLETVGHPCALNPDPDLLEAAKERGWPIAHLTRDPDTGLSDLVRTGLAYSAMAAGISGGMSLAFLTRSRKEGADFLAGPACDAALLAAGVKLNVVGRENAFSDRPAIFLFNHQSELDVIVLGSVLRKDLTAVAKKELQSSPFFAPMGYLGDVAYVDRADREKAIEALQPAVDALKRGKSLMVAPEGTRSDGQGLLPFKKGPFHMAMQAGVPVVPFIMRNCAELMTAHSYIIHPGTVDVAVLEPIPTDDWTPENMEDKIEAVRQLFVRTLEKWPHKEADLPSLG